MSMRPGSGGTLGAVGSVRAGVQRRAEPDCRQNVKATHEPGVGRYLTQAPAITDAQESHTSADDS